MTQSIGKSLEALADAVDAVEGAFDVAMSADDLAAICGDTPKTLADIVDALGDLATEDTVGDLATQATLETLALETTATSIKTAAEAIAGNGLPVLGQDATGQDTYGTIATAPARVCHHLLAQCATKAAIISLNGGTADHIRLEPGTVLHLDGLTIASGAEIQAKNADAGQNYTALSISVW